MRQTQIRNQRGLNLVNDVLTVSEQTTNAVSSGDNIQLVHWWLMFTCPHDPIKRGYCESHAGVYVAEIVDTSESAA